MRARIALWQGLDARVDAAELEIARLHRDLTTGPLRDKGGRRLMQLLHSELPESVPSDALSRIKYWLAAIKSSERYRQLELHEIAQDVRTSEEFHIDEFLPLKRVAA